MREKELVASLRGLSSDYGEFSNVICRVVDTVKGLKPLIGEREEKATASKLISIGAAIIALPDPFIVTDVAGSALVAAGLIKKKMKQPTISDVSREAKEMIKKLERTTRELNPLTKLSFR